MTDIDIDTNQTEKKLNPHDLALDGQKVSNEAELEAAEEKEIYSVPDNPLSDYLSSEKEELEDFSDKQALEFEVNDFGKLFKKFEKFSENLIQDLMTQNKELKQQAYTLNKLPEKTGERLVSLIPRISEELHKRMLEDFDRELELRNAKMTEMFQRLEERQSAIDQSLNTSHAKLLESLSALNARFQQVQNIQLKKKILTYTISTLFLFAVAFSACWTTFKYFPSKVLINEGSNITVQGSNVTVWSKDYKIIDKVTNKEGSKPAKR